MKGKKSDAAAVEHPASRIVRKIKILEAKNQYDIARVPETKAHDKIVAKIDNRTWKRLQRLESRLALEKLTAPNAAEDVLIFIAGRLEASATYNDFADGEIDLYAGLIRSAVSGLLIARDPRLAAAMSSAAP